MLFERTTCSCAECVRACYRQPGPLAPGDVERIAAFLKITLTEAKTYFCASPGALVGDSRTGRVWRIGSITPKKRRGRCVFLDAEDRCRIHPVSPAGCAWFSACTPSVTNEDQRRSHALAVAQTDPDYQALRATLDVK
jgi:Fe-S-cluster containining protein